MKMFIANASAQEHLFIYRLPEVNKQRQLTIRRGGQIPIPDDLSQKDIDAIVEQHERYGFASVSEVRTNTVKKRFTRLVYSTTGPVPGPIIEALINSNHGVLDAQGRVIRQQTAIAANAKIMEELQKAKEKDGVDADVGAIDLTIQEEEPRGGYDRPTAEIVSEGFKVDTEGPAKTAGRGRRKH